jgi:hypothetical protein
MTQLPSWNSSRDKSKSTIDVSRMARAESVRQSEAPEDMPVRVTKSGPRSSLRRDMDPNSKLVDPLLPESGTRKSRVSSRATDLKIGGTTEGSMLCLQLTGKNSHYPRQPLPSVPLLPTPNPCSEGSMEPQFPVGSPWSRRSHLPALSA